MVVPSIWCLMDACIPRITPTAAANGVPSVAAVPSGVTGLVVVAAESADTKLPCWSMILQQMLLFCYKISTPQPFPILRYWAAGVYRFMGWYHCRSWNDMENASRHSELLCSVSIKYASHGW